ncbi:MAG: hypothetical protein DWQ31_20320 [Planctomycetota bacterium]|nr:MAG: hypothetical protein DWQ31_20320 [Planctomycetota bacterium]REJ96482.1 MAG: hypothetical protein DWQ35_04615 [Planctomycetota bacterium]REK25126.1 MAG: hypothetical protein DWQ42_12205 [Planctomycetota bacterium]REK40518.1 MAG: hypothetical protein DWQ46_16135 [Planctomycetota bacterium]
MIGVFLLLPLLQLTSHGEEPNESNKRREFMEAKLVDSQAILESLTREDFRAMAKHAQSLSLLTLEEGWQVLQTEEYLQQSRGFRRSADTLRKAAEDENLQAATLAFVELTIKCIDCHRYIRGNQREAAR